MIKVLIVDDHPIVRKGLKLIVESNSDMSVVDEAKDISDLLCKIGKDGYCDVLVMDISRTNGEGTEVIKQLKTISPDLPILIFSVHSQDQDAIRMLKAGATGYITKESTPEEFIAAIRKLSTGKNHISTTIMDQLLCSLNLDSEQNPHELLSNREYEVFHGLASGMTLRHIADELHISEKTVSTYRSRVLNKMKMGTNCELIRYGLKKGLVE